MFNPLNQPCSFRSSKGFTSRALQIKESVLSDERKTRKWTQMNPKKVHGGGNVQVKIHTWTHTCLGLFYTKEIFGCCRTSTINTCIVFINMFGQQVVSLPSGRWEPNIQISFTPKHFVGLCCLRNENLAGGLEKILVRTAGNRKCFQVMKPEIAGLHQNLATPGMAKHKQEAMWICRDPRARSHSWSGCYPSCP